MIPNSRRGDIQGLRAVAVGIVVAFHAFPQALTGGFVGVDVFFVISGFLITGVLLREVESTGRVSLPRFYARRIRRLLPAALVTTIMTLIGAGILFGPVRLVSTLQDAAWATFSAANFRFSTGDGYFTQGDPSPFLHFWSLSVEEQFYLIWPAVLLVLAVIPWGRGVLPVLLVVVIGGSLITSIYQTDAGSASAYYSLLTRAWELGIGALLSLAALHGVVLCRRLGSAAAIVGILMIVGSAILYSSATPFPGWTAAVPVLGSALVIWGGQGPVAWLLSTRPFTYIGDISYSLYLWHWPVFVLGPLVIGTSIGASMVLIAAAIALAGLSYHFVERRGQRIRRTARSGFVVATGLAAVMLVSGCSAVASTQVPLSSSAPVAIAPTAAPSAAPMGPGPVPAAVPANVTPTLDHDLEDLATVFTNGCFQGKKELCSSGTGAKSIVLAGDSHAGMWWPTFTAIAAENGWTVHVVGHNGCPIVDVPISQAQGSLSWPECSAWQAGAIAEVAAWHPDLIVLDNNTTGYMAKVSLRDDFAGSWEPALSKAVTQLQDIAPVLFMGQVPTFPTQPVDCLSDHLSDVPACSIALAQAVPAVVRDMNERVAAATGVAYQDPTRFLCTDTCPLMAYNMIMYRDASHLNATYAAHLAPLIQRFALAAMERGTQP